MRFEISEILKQGDVMELVYGNCKSPKKILGRHFVENGQVICAYHPDALSMRLVREDGKKYQMDSVERQPVFAIFFPELQSFGYEIEMDFRDGHSFRGKDPYGFQSQITMEEEQKFLSGRWLNSYEKMGCHPMKIQGVWGMYFAVWAPSARRVSVVGDFNYWNGMVSPMSQLTSSGIFEIFLPNIKEGELYKYEIKTSQGELLLKADPYAFMGEFDAGHASEIVDMNRFHWTDGHWMRSRHQRSLDNDPVALCELPITKCNLDKTFFEIGYSHVLLAREKRVMHNRGFFAPSDYYGTADDLRAFIDLCHNNKTGVLIHITLGSFGKGEFGLSGFDGTSLYGFADGRMRINQGEDACRFNHKKPEVVNYILSNLLFLIRNYHIDGFVFEEITDMILADENTLKKMDKSTERAVSDTLMESGGLLKRALKVIRNEDSSVLVIADEKTEEYYPVSDLYSENLGFDFVKNYSVKINLDTFLKSKVSDRQKEYFRLTLPLEKAGMERTILLFNHHEITKMNDEIFDNWTSDDYDKLAGIRMTYGYILGVPGKKAWMSHEGDSLENGRYIRRLLGIYKEYSALHEYDIIDAPLEWINGMDAETLVVSFIRRSTSGKKNLLFVCNFSPVELRDYQLGVPKYLEYRLILNSDGIEYGGQGRYVDQKLMAESEVYNLRPYSIHAALPPYSTLIFEY